MGWLLLLPIGALAWYLLVWRRRDDEDEDAQPVSSGAGPAFGSPRGLPQQRRTATELPGSPKGLPGQRAATPDEERTPILDPDE